MFTQRSFAIAGITVVAVLAAIGITWSNIPPKIIELSFEQEDGGADADKQTLDSIREVGSLYTVNYHGDYEERLRWLNDYHLQGSAKLSPASSCSHFATQTGTGEPLLGRNFDRLRETPVLVRFLAPGKYASFAFSPASEVYVREVWGVAHPTEDQKNKFLFCLPFYATDGINEKGVSIAIAGAPPRRVQRSETRPSMFVLLFIRRVLDNCQNVEEVARFADTVSLYDSALDTISHHLIVTDADGHWLVIDYPDGSLRITRGQGEPQVRTNHFLDVGSTIQDNSFSRYDTLSEALHSPEPLSSGVAAMKLLKRVRNETKWSVVYDSHARGGLVAVKKNYRALYHSSLPNSEQ